MNGLIYKATNATNRKVYIGRTTRSLNERICRHYYDSKKRNYPFYNALNKYERNSFIWEVIDTFTTHDEGNEKESFWINKCNSLIDNGCGYNLIAGGSQPLVSESVKAKMRKAWLTRQPMSSETKEKIRLGLIGRTCSEETRNKIAAAHKGRKVSDKHLQAIREAKKRPISEETRKRMSLGQLGKKHSDITRAKMSASQTGLKKKPFSDEARRNMSLAQLGKTFSEETRKLRSQITKEWWRQRKLEKGGKL